MSFLSGKVAIISGASRGIGAAAGRVFATAGASVVLAAADEQGLAVVVHEITTAGGRSLAVPTDVGDSAAVERLVQRMLDWLLTHPVNNFWLKDFKLEGASRRFFAFDPLRRQADTRTPDWTVLRNRWEWSHVLRAGLGLLGLTLLGAAVAL